MNKHVEIYISLIIKYLYNQKIIQSFFLKPLNSH